MISTKNVLRKCNCGNEDVHSDYNEEEDAWIVFCWVCLAHTTSSKTEQGAIVRWEASDVL